MKDLKHYFTENSRTCDTSSNVVAKNDEAPTNDRENDHSNAEEPSKEVKSTTKKRGRVKIKIRKSHSRGKICDIVDNNSDLVDKTPSPYATRDTKKNDDKVSHHRDDDTPKRSKSRKIVENKNSKDSSNSEEKTNVESVNSDDENDHSVSNNNCIDAETVVRESVESIATNNVDESLVDIDKIERQESNAFRVLMERKKPLQYKTMPASTQQDEELAAKIVEETRNKLKKNRDKLTLLADKKGYAKRKLNEIEEAEKIERRLEKRAKLFRQAEQKESEDKNCTSAARKSSGSLHNYFGKSTHDGKEKDVNEQSDIMVKADVHISDSSDSPIFESRKTLCAKTLAKKSDEIMKPLGATDVIRPLESSDMPTTNGESKIDGNCVKKPRWSLRINLQCNDRNDNDDSTIQKANKTHREKKESKSRRVQEKARNYKENECSDGAGTCTESIKKNRKERKKKSSNEENRSIETKDQIIIDNSISPTVKNIVEILETNVEEKITIKNEKLAPLFVKRQKPDPAIIEARRAFLTSVPTENLRKNNREIPLTGVSILPFPAISHVTQRDNEKVIINREPELNFPIREIRPFVPKYDLRKFKELTSIDDKQSRNNTDDNSLTKANIEEVLREIESRCSDAREIWARISPKIKEQADETKKSPKRRGSKKKKSSAGKNIDDSTGDNIDRDCAWTEKYRPRSTRDIVGNEEAADKFRKWLSSWKIESDNDDNSSGDEFYSSDCDYRCNSDNYQVAVLLGPHGCGKTATVYAIAQELGYSVLEINASSKRAGKKILREIEEATKSHRIKKHDFTPLDKTTSNNVKATTQNSLILVEDIDLIFDEDEGFISATCQLVTNTKRPIVMTGRRVCSYLNKMAPKQMRINYENTFGTRVSAYLELITLAESGYRLPRSCLDRLLENGDLRKALLQLQYLLISGKPNDTAVSTNFHQSLWQDMRTSIYKPAIRGMKKLKKKHANTEKSSTSFSKTKSIIDNLANDLEKLAFLSTLIEIDDPAIEMSSLKLEPGLSLDESTHDYSNTRVTSNEIAKWLRDRLMNDGIANDNSYNNLNNLRQLSLKKDFNVSVNMALSQVSPNILDRRTTMIDYLSTVRTICRIEERKSMKSNKRGNRFFHYLQNLRLPAFSIRPNILEAACKMLCDEHLES